MAKRGKEEVEDRGHEGYGCCCCGGGGRGRFWKGVLVGLLAAWVYCRIGCRHMCQGPGMGCQYGQMGQGAVMQPVPTPVPSRK